MSNKDGNEQIKYPHAIICEGADAKFYLIWLLRWMIQNSGEKFENFQVIDGGGNDDLPSFVKNLNLLPGFANLKTLTIIRDAEKNASDAHQSVQRLFQNAKFAVPNAPCTPARPDDAQHSVITAYALFPAFDALETNGTLEDLCLKTLAGDKTEEYLNISDAAIGQVNERCEKLKRPHKNRLSTYLSLSNDYVTLKLGESARAGAFDFDAPELSPLKAFLKGMLNSVPSI